jgi:hypothetical protein
MKIRCFHWIACLLFTSSTALAQDTTILFEDFENGLPPDWQVSGVPMWHVTQNGDCGSVTRMLAFNSGNPGCTYATGAVIPGGVATLPPLGQISPLAPWQLSFDYILDVDATGDDVVLTSTNQAGIPIVFAGQQLINDGALHSIVLEVPSSTYPFPGISIYVFGDGVGDQGRGLMIDNVRFSNTALGAIYCTGATNASCPCNNGGGPQRGCGNSLGIGAYLRGTGNPSLANDTLTLGVGDVPPAAPTLFFGGSSAINAPFGDGVRCVGGSITRLRIKTSPTGTAVYPEQGDAAISTVDPVSAGTTRHYQAMYRNLAGPCGGGFNLTNGWKTTWQP